MRAHDLYTHVDPTTVSAPENFLNETKENIESDTDSSYGDDNFVFKYNFA